MKELKRGKQIGNKGSTLIVVLVSVVFMTVLGTIIVAVSTANLQMKFQEYASKRNFYTDERVLEDIYHGIGKVANEHLAAAYRDVLTHTVTNPGSGSTSDYADAVGYDSQEAAFNDFSRGFVRRLISAYGDNGGADDSTLATLQSYIAEVDPGIGGDTDKPSIYVESFREIDIIDIDEEAVTKDEITPVVTSPENLKVPYQYIFRDVKVVYRDTDSAGRESGYETTITTDIVIEVPYVNFFQDSSRILDYAMIANRGIYIGGEDSSKAADRSIVGNVYAGIGRAEDDSNADAILQQFHGIGDGVSGAAVGVYGGLNILNSTCLFSSNYLISKGDINVRGTDLTIRSDLSDAGGQVWVESIRTVGKENLREEPGGSAVKAEGVSFYVANDLELNENSSSFVMAGGNYYGYNAGNYSTWEEKGPLLGKYSSLQHAGNSAVILNGSDTSVELAGEVVINGVAYMDLASRPAGDSYQPLQNGTGEYATGESLAFKSNQYIYLAPSDCLSTTNPVNLDSEVRPTDPAEDKPWIDSTETDNWFGYYSSDVIEAYVEKGDPLIARDVVDRLSPAVPKYRFYFLKIKEGMAAKFAGLVMNMPGPPEGAEKPEGSARIAEIMRNSTERQRYQELFEYYHYDDYSSAQQDQIWELKKSLTKRLSAAGNIATDAYSRLYAQGAFPSYNGTDLTAEDKLLEDSKRLSVEYAGKLESDFHKRYVSLYQSLDPKEGVRLDGDETVDGGNYADISGDRAPADKFVDFTKLEKALDSDNRKWDRYRNTYESLISSGNIVLHSAEGDFSGIIVCNGDVTVSSGVNVKGLIIAGGKIIIEGDGYIEGNRGIVQEILDEEMELDSARPLVNNLRPLEILDYVTTYLSEIKVNYSATDKTERVRGTDYTQYMSYDNWRKG